MASLAPGRGRRNVGRADEAQVDFGRDIRPVLSDKCFACHGPDDSKREGGFRLDVKESAYGEADSGERPIVPGKPAASEMLARIRSDDESIRMPPPDATKQLTAEEIALLEKWIQQGAAWQEHWSLVPPQSSEPPSVRQSEWPRNAIDKFILARLEEEGLTPQSEAEARTLLRRVTLDLTGLPPTPAEVEAFLADKGPDAYERAVDRLLKSSRYGEHMARYWLDAARYGDTHGLHLDNYREMWPYRDWVVNAFNANMPYDRFTIEQLAGDLLPNATLAQRIATGFNRAHVTTNEGGSIKEEVYVRNVVDRTVTFGTVFMGMTFECSRCHDHKFDPLTMKDFYSLFAFFNSLDGNPLDGNRKDHAPVLRVPTEEQQVRLAEFDATIAELEAKLRDPWPELDRQQIAWEQELRTSLAAAESESSKPLLTVGDWYTVGPFTDNRRYLYRRKHGPEGKPIKLDQKFGLVDGSEASWKKRPDWKDGSPHTGLPGDLAANFLYREINAAKKQRVEVSLGSDDAIKVYLNGKQVLAKDVARGVAPDQDKVTLALKEGVNELLIKIMNYGGASGFYFALAGPTSLPADLVAAVKTPDAERTAAQGTAIREYFRTKVVEFEPLEAARAQLVQARNDRAAVDRSIPTTLIWKETKDPRPAYLLTRGEYDQRGPQVERATPVVLPGMDDQLPRDRLGLARWLTSPQHPLTARVQVNRLWQQLFGTGLVETAEDFGSQGALPSHPELLDWLAVQFIEDGWDVKRMLKRMVMSATYRQSSRVTNSVFERDPANRLLARGPRFRLDAEVLRDQALFVGGLLSETMGGPSVRPPQPGGLWFAVGYSGSNTVRFVADKGHDRVHRRTLYTFIKRTAPPPQMSIVDAPSREACVVRRERTNTPLQALLFFNDPQFVEAARGLAQRTLREGGNDLPSQARFMFQCATGRPPSNTELADLIAGVVEDLQHYKADLEAARRLLAVGSAPRNEKLPISKLAAWTVTANMLLNLDEVVSKN